MYEGKYEKRDGRGHESGYHGGGHESGYHGGGHESGHRGGGFSIASLLDGKPDAQLLFVGAVSCTRHRGFQMGELMREGKMAILCPTATDYATGRYLSQIEEAVIEVAQERKAKEVVLMYGCQCAVLSTDYELMKQQLKEEYDIELTIHDSCHLCRTDEDWRHGR